MGEQHRMKPQLVMYRPNLQELPQLELPFGYTLRSFQSGDEASWESIINQSFQYRSNFTEEIEKDKNFSPERVLFICYRDVPIATATAWHRPIWGEHTGYLHMVGVLANHGGKALGAQASLAAIYQMRDEGRKVSVLETDDFRIPAIKTYLKLGYKPLLIHENQGKRWHDIIDRNNLNIDSEA